ncbi:MAG: hypothetical protein JRJ51_23125 [Deltaproteobacteria bacterium]|nr:hypothetical protein [Deltaproteobacteria bacterium]
MKAERHSLLTDIKAAARIGHAESLWLALDGLFDLPEVAGNPPLNEAFIRQMIFPIGEALATPRVTRPMLYPLVSHDHAAIRAIAGTVIAKRYFEDEKVEVKELVVHGQDPRKDVRLAVVLALSQAGADQPDKFQELIQNWLQWNSPRLQAVALQLLPSLAKQHPAISVEILSDFQASGDPELRTALVDCLVALAQGNLADAVLTLLEGRVVDQGNNLWVIGKTLSRSWVVPYADRGIDILSRLAEQHGPEKILIKALKAMQRHGAEHAIAEAVSKWQQDSNPNLLALAEQMTERSGK